MGQIFFLAFLCTDPVGSEVFCRLDNFSISGPALLHIDLCRKMGKRFVLKKYPQQLLLFFRHNFFKSLFKTGKLSKVNSDAMLCQASKVCRCNPAKSDFGLKRPRNPPPDSLPCICMAKRSCGWLPHWLLSLQILCLQDVPVVRFASWKETGAKFLSSKTRHIVQFVTMAGTGRTQTWLAKRPAFTEEPSRRLHVEVPTA